MNKIKLVPDDYVKGSRLVAIIFGSTDYRPFSSLHKVPPDSAGK